MIRDSCAIGRYDGSIVAQPNGTSDGSRIAARIFVYASVVATRDGLQHVRGGRGSSVSAPRRRTKWPDFGRTSMRPAFSSRR